MADRFVDSCADLVQRSLIDERADHRVHLGGTADLEGLRFGDQLVGEFFGDRAFDDDAPRRHTDLSLVQVCAEGGRVDGVVQVSIGEHDQWVLATKLEHHPLQLAGRLLGQDPPGPGRSGEADPAHLWVFHEFVDHRFRLAGCVGDDVDHPGREAGLFEDLRVEDASRDRRLF